MPSITRIKTPENIEVRFYQAGLVTRGIAYMLDLALLILCSIPTLPFLGYIRGVAHGYTSYGSVSALILLFLVHTSYFLFCELLFAGTTLGKRFFSIRVVTNHGQRPGFYHSLIRNVLRCADYLPHCYFLGMAIALGTERHQRLGDYLAETMVVKDSPKVDLNKRLTS